MKSRVFSLIAIVIFLAAGGVLAATSHSAWAADVWLAGVACMGAPLIVKTIREVTRGRLATDVVASLSILGAIVLGQPVAGLVIVLMQTGVEDVAATAMLVGDVLLIRSGDLIPCDGIVLDGESDLDTSSASTIDRTRP